MGTQLFLNKFVAASLMILISLLLLSGCAASPPPASTSDRVDIRGIIMESTTINKSDSDVAGHMLIHGNIEKDTVYDKASVTVKHSTKIFIRSKGKTVRAGFDDLAVGVKVEVEFDGPVAESYPVQATAGKIVISAN